MIKFLLPLFLCCSLQAQIVIRGSTLRGATLGAANASSGGSGFVIVHTNSASASGANPTSVVIDLTGSKLIIVNCALSSVGGSPANPTDDQSHTYLPLNGVGRSNGDDTNRMFYAIGTFSGSATVSSTYNFTVNNVATFTCGLTPFFDTQSAGTFVFSGTSVQPGSISPAGSSELFITGLCNDASASAATIDSSFLDAGIGRQGAGLWGQLAYKVSSSAENPTWTITGGNQSLSSTHAVFGQH